MNAFTERPSRWSPAPQPQIIQFSFIGLAAILTLTLSFLSPGAASASEGASPSGASSEVVNIDAITSTELGGSTPSQGSTDTPPDTTPKDTQGSNPEILDYWTAERMENALPIVEPVTEEASKDGGQATEKQSPRSTTNAQNVEPQTVITEPAPATGDEIVPLSASNLSKTNGKVFFHNDTDGQDYVCSGSAINSSSKRVVSTAGHCVYDASNKKPYSNWIFAPKYRRGETPYGKFTAYDTMTFADWVNYGPSPRGYNSDVAFVTTYRNTDGQRVVDAVGGHGLTTGGSHEFDTDIFGYPGNLNDGEIMRTCFKRTTQENNGGFLGIGGYDFVRATGCNFGRGSSGGPWLYQYSNTTGLGYIRSITSHGPENNNYIQGPYFRSDVATLLTTANSKWTNESLDPAFSAPSAGSITGNTTANSGSTVSLSASATGYPTPTIQWQSRANTSSAWSDISGATSRNYSFKTYPDDNGKQFRAVFTNKAGVSNSSPVTLNIKYSPTNTKITAPSRAKVGDTVTLAASAQSNPSSGIQWSQYVSTKINLKDAFSDKADWKVISGNPGKTLNYTVTTPGWQFFKAAFINTVGTSTTETAIQVERFQDVSFSIKASEYNLFASDIEWLAQQEITTGWEVGGGKREFRPLNNVTRDAAAAFLYRLAGKPAYTPPVKSPFRDVKTTDLYYKEISWMAQQGISTGWDTGNGGKEFRPLDSINRDAFAVFLYRLAGKPAFTAPETSSFTDVATNNMYYREISWMAQQGISTGWDNASGKKEFRPLDQIHRDAVAAFLHRYDNL